MLTRSSHDMRSRAHRLSSRMVRFVAILAAFSGCADEGRTPIPDEPITADEVAAGERALQSGTNPSAEATEAEPTDDTDGLPTYTAPETPEPSAEQCAADLRMLAGADTSAVDTIDTTPVDPATEEDLRLIPNDLDGSVEAFSSCRRATGYVNGHRHTICVTHINGKLVAVRTARAFVRMRAAARHDGVSLWIVSGFRTMAQQRHLYHLYLTGRGNLAARPGYSNHQSGIALDLNTSSHGVYRWLAHHARHFGFVRTVPSEIWHWEYRLRH